MTSNDGFFWSWWLWWLWLFYDILLILWWVCWFWCSSWFLLCSLWLVVGVDELAEMMNSICGFSMSLGCDPGSASRTGWVLTTHQLQTPKSNMEIHGAWKIEIPIPKFVFLMLALLDSIKFRGCTSIRTNDQCGRKRARPAVWPPAFSQCSHRQDETWWDASNSGDVWRFRTGKITENSADDLWYPLVN